MSATYGKPDADAEALLARALRDFHPRLHEAEVRVALLMAANGEGPALKKAGYPCAALVSVVPLDWRLLCDFDARIKIDRRTWDDLTEDGRLALLDHELSHLQLDGTKRDDLGRPKLKAIPADWNGGDGFKEVVARHGEAALEYENARRVAQIAEDAHDLGRR
jgi:hypothetical protein